MVLIGAVLAIFIALILMFIAHKKPGKDASEKVMVAIAVLLVVGGLLMVLMSQMGMFG